MVRVGGGDGGQAGWWNLELRMSVYRGVLGASWSPSLKGNKGAYLEFAFAQ